MGERMLDGSGDELLLPRHPSVSGCFSLQYIVLKQEGKRTSGKENRVTCALHIFLQTLAHTCRFEASSSM